MSIAPTLQRYLTAENIQYDVIPRDPTMSSTRTAEACRISGDRLAKAIVLRHIAGYMLAVLPASHHVRLSDLRDQLGDNVEMAQESEIDPLFPDCARTGLFHPSVTVTRCLSSWTTASRRSQRSIWRRAITRRCSV
jgi:Ala-tRNA(Pro) deacylase